MFRKKTSQKPTEISSKGDVAKFCLKYDKPKILLIDLPEEAANGLSERGYNVSIGSFGNPYKVPQSDSYEPVICNGVLPNVTEQEIVIIDLEEPPILKEPKGQKHTSVGENDWWASCNHGVIDPRPRMMAFARQHFDRILSHGGLLIIFAKEREFQKMMFGHSSRYGIEGQDIHYDNWSFLGCLDNARIKINCDTGTEMFTLDKDGPLSKLLTKFIKDSNFFCTMERNYETNKENWIPLLKNKYDSIVSVAIAHAYAKEKHTYVLIFPQFRNKSDFVLDLFEVLPNPAPHLFPYYEGNLWLHKEEYELPQVNQLEAKKIQIRKQCDDELERINLQIEKEKEDNKFWYNLIRETGDPLVQAVIKTLGLLGFEQIIDVDKEVKAEASSGSLREDIQIKDVSPILIVDVKGIADLPSDAEATQAHKHAAMRMKEWDRTDINSLTIINHQRNIPPLERENDKPYRQELLDGASRIDLGLMTAWDLYRLLRSFLRNQWSPENVKPLFYRSQRISLIPINYEYVGEVEQIWRQAEAFSVVVEKAILELNDKIGIETPIEILEYEIASLMLKDQKVLKIEIGSEAGVKTNQFPSSIRKGFRVYKVKS